MGRVLGIDHGDRRIGLALSDPLRLVACPFKTLYVKDIDAVLLELQRLVVEQDVSLIVIGLPKGMRSQHTEQTGKVLSFAARLAELHIPVEYEDERLSSIAARKSLVAQNIKTGHNKSLVDQTAAALVLQQYLDRTRS